MLDASALYREIHEQPAAAQRLLDAGQAPVRALAAAIQAHGIRHVVIAARGTSDNAARYAQYVLGAHNGLLVSLATPSLFSIYQLPPRLAGTLVLGISQSGQSPDLVAVLAEARAQGVLTAAITNDPASPLAAQADLVVPLLAGPEHAVAATKTYTCQLLAIAMLSAALSAAPAHAKELATVPALMQSTLDLAPALDAHAQRYRLLQRCVVIGRGFNYATAFELALKLKELTYAIVEPYSSADFLHGPLAIIEPGFPVLLVAPEGAVLPELRTFLATVQERGAEVLAISNADDILDAAALPLPLPAALPEWLSPLVAIIPGQLFALHMAHARGLSVDAPRGLSKVTETR